NRARRGVLLVEELHQVPRGALVEQMSLLQPCERGLGLQRDELARRPPDRLAELVRTTDTLALPERHRTRDARRRRHEHAVARDLLDPPGRCPEQERLSRARLVDHLLVELADPPAALDEVDTEEAAVGNRPGVRDRQAAHAASAADHAGGAIPDDSRP